MPKPYNKPLARTLLAAACTLAIGATAHAVKPASFTHTTEADFADGDAQNTVVTNLGDLKLSSDIETIEGLPEDVTVIHDAIKIGNATYLAVGPQAKVLRLTDDGVEVVVELPGEQVFCFTESAGDLVVAVSSNQNSRLAVLDGDRLRTIHEFEDVKYIWDAVGAGLEIYAATGPQGKVIAASNDPNGAVGKGGTIIFEAAQANILSLIMGNGHLYAGTDTDGLIYRLTEVGDKPWDSFVIYDAPEAEVSSLVVMPDGTLYAGTSAADQAKPGRLAKPVDKEEGRPAPPEVQPEEVEQPEQPEQADAEEAPADEASGTDTQQPKPKPTAEQYDALRQELRERLVEARASGSLNGDGAAVAQAPAQNTRPANRPSRAKPAAPPQSKKGNAIYQISPEGFVAEVFRESAMILSIIPHGDKLIVATGNEGEVFSVDPALKETTVLAELDSLQVTCAIPTDQGLMLGAANPGALVRMSTAVANEGLYTSRVLDARQVSLYGMFKITADIPEGTSVGIEMRSGNVGDPEQAAWSKWTPTATLPGNADANPLQPREVRVEVPPARYLQYRLVLKGDDKATPTIDQVDIAYVAPNTAPTVQKLIAKPAPVKAPGNDPDPKVTIQWQASDDNQDRLVYSIAYKPGKADRYLTLAEDLATPKYEWQTQHVPDGWYTVRVTAHDKLDNPTTSAKTGGRVSETLLIDNTAPALEGLKAEVKDGNVVLSAQISDELSSITSVAYSINGSDEYQASLPEDLIYDSTSEAWGVTISDLPQGGHVIAVRAIDAKGNTAYRQLIVTVQ